MRWLVTCLVLVVLTGTAPPVAAQTCEEIEAAYPELVAELARMNESIGQLRKEVQDIAEDLRRARDLRVERADAFRTNPTPERRASLNEAQDRIAAARARLAPARDALQSQREDRDVLTADIEKVQTVLETECAPPVVEETSPQVTDPLTDDVAPGDDLAVDPGLDATPQPDSDPAPSGDEPPAAVLTPEVNDAPDAAPERVPGAAYGEVVARLDETPPPQTNEDVAGAEDPPLAAPERDPQAEPEAEQVTELPDIYTSIMPSEPTGPTPPGFEELGALYPDASPDRQPFALRPPDDQPGNGWRISVEGTLFVEQLQRRGGRRARREDRYSEENIQLELIFDDFGVLVDTAVNGKGTCTAHGGLWYDNTDIGWRFITIDPATGETLNVQAMLTFLLGDGDDAVVLSIVTNANVLAQAEDGQSKWTGSLFSQTPPETGLERITIEDREICPVW